MGRPGITAPIAPMTTKNDPKIIQSILAMGLFVSLAVCMSLSESFNWLQGFIISREFYMNPGIKYVFISCLDLLQNMPHHGHQMISDQLL